MGGFEPSQGDDEGYRWRLRGKQWQNHLAHWEKPDTKWTVRTIWGFEELAGRTKFVQRLQVWNRKGEQAIIKNGVWSRQGIALIKDLNQAHIPPFSVHATCI